MGWRVWTVFHLFCMFVVCSRQGREKNDSPTEVSIDIVHISAGKPYWRGRLSTVDLLVLNSLYQLSLYWKYYLPFFTKQATLMRRSTVLSLPLQLVFLDTRMADILRKRGRERESKCERVSVRERGNWYEGWLSDISAKQKRRCSWRIDKYNYTFSLQLFDL